jgi:predicted glycoside hydrolase/deacetylase ChbG (UPF0249 family)
VSAVAEAQLATAATEQAAPLRRIWLCADDYGIAPGVNTAIRDLIVRGRLNATSVMVHAPSCSRSEAVSLSILNTMSKRAAIGLHVTLTAPFRPASENFKPLKHGAFLPLKQLLRVAVMGKLDAPSLAAEVSAQFKAFQNLFGRAPDFVDGHQHVHLFPQIRDAVLAATKQHAPQAWVRQCGRRIALRKRLADRKGLLLDYLSREFRRRAERLGIRTNPGFAGTYDFGTSQPFAELFPRFLDDLPDGGLVMCHPGVVDAELERLDPLTTLREQELAYFNGDEFLAVLARHNVALAEERRAAPAADKPAAVARNLPEPA